MKRRVARPIALTGAVWLLAAPLAFGPAACGSHDDGSAADAAADAITVPMPDSGDEQVLRGWASVNARGCPDCHQSPDLSDGILSGQTTVAPNTPPGTMAYGSNLTPDPDTGMDGWDAAAIVTAIRQGIKDQGQPLCAPMPKVKDMSDDEAHAIAAYLQSLVAVHRDIPASLCGQSPGGGSDGALPGDDGGASVDASTDASDAGADAPAVDAGDDASVDSANDAPGDTSFASDSSGGG
jgi:hypothetical protein